LARFLCGLSSPATTRAKLHRNEQFGILAEVPFLEVLGHTEEL
jgi:ATP-dependent DNA helicase RecQ